MSINSDQIEDAIVVEETKLTPSDLPENPTDKLVIDALANTDKPLTEDQQILRNFQAGLNAFIEKVESFEGSKRQLQRVLINLAISPLNAEELHHGYPEEKELFELGNEVNSSKFFLMLSGAKDNNSEPNVAAEETQALETSIASKTEENTNESV